MGNRLDDMRDASFSLGWRRAAWLVAAAITSFAVWANFAELDEVAVAPGEVVPRDKVKVIQHLEGGIIEQILVEEGDHVGKGQALVELHLPVSNFNRDEMQVRSDGLKLAAARLSAEVAEGDLEFPGELAATRPDLARAEEQVFLARRSEFQAKLAVLDEQTRQRRIAITELNSAIDALTADLGLARDNLKMSADLLRDQMTSKMDHLAREREVRALEGQLTTKVQSTSRASSALREVEQQLIEERRTFTRSALEDLGEVEVELARTSELLQEADEQSDRRIIRSPIDGIVKNLRYHTIGGVVRSGDAIMEVVPSDGDLVIEARLSPADRGYVSAGQSVRAKISAYDFIRFGAVDGTILKISADSTIDEEGRPYYQVIMQPARTYLGEIETDMPIMPGMIATLDIRTGKKTVLEFLAKPLITIRDSALHER